MEYIQNLELRRPTHSFTKISQNRKLWQVEHTDEVISFENLFMEGDSEMPSGVDNRNLVDSNSKAQGITREQIEGL